MQAAFDSRAMFSMNFSRPSFSSASSGQDASYMSSRSLMTQDDTQVMQPPIPRGFGGENMSSSNFNYSTQQMSRGPNGFSQSGASGSYSSFQRHSPGQDLSYNSMQSSSYSNQVRGALGYDRSSQRNQWSDTGVHNGKASIDLGDYKLDLNKSNSSVTLTNANGDKTKVWGDPHIDLNSGTAKQTSGMFNGPINFELPDHTNVNIGTQPAKGNPKVSFADKVTVTQGDRAYVVNGLSEKNGAPLTVQRSNDGYALAQDSQSGMHLQASAGGTGWTNAQTQQAVTAADFKA